MQIQLCDRLTRVTKPSQQNRRKLASREASCAQVQSCDQGSLQLYAEDLKYSLQTGLKLTRFSSAELFMVLAVARLMHEQPCASLTPGADLDIVLRVSLAEEHKEAKGQGQVAAEEAEAQAHICEEGRNGQRLLPEGGLHGRAAVLGPCSGGCAAVQGQQQHCGGSCRQVEKNRNGCRRLTRWWTVPSAKG